ncbi:peptide chain release factor N(5)-glutamine methyltransferase [Anaeromassilibacillus senegalensis]|uniref:peptide chain release factor N(5)-glutamine methyltransferase n=1 Tax=Anaeromassilibacillus senegalensis TaxID=1673717 RepID=UPI0006807068|nr:peptide chain release factor N(5)-glutamine methyltransferase [Anaeromassilibacillus senegalensis]
MTLRETYQKGKMLLQDAENEVPAFDAICLFQKTFGLDRQQLILHGEQAAKPEQAEAFLALCGERAQGRPLQYILGEWPFMDFTLTVGEGVLCPREETELLVYTAAERLKGRRNIHAVDLCGGSGAVALGLASLLPEAEIACVERYEEAYRYLEENIRRTGFSNVTPLRLDVLEPSSAVRLEALDAIVSNPPYVRAEEIPQLQAEVRREPRTALDGGADGLLFYRAIVNLWLPKLKPGGVAAVEIGENQGGPVQELFECAGLEYVKVIKDFNGLDRVVVGSRHFL